MSSSLLSVMIQSSTGADWNWLLIFIVSVIVLAIALVVQTRFSKQEAAELEHHADEAPHEKEDLVPDTAAEPEASSEPGEENATLEAEALPSAPVDHEQNDGSDS